MTDPVDLFAFKINYDKQPGNSQVQALYNGNISETYWKTNTDLTKRSYGYQYDKLNRLTSAIYSKPNDAIPVSGAYNESLSYDKNGNIKSLQRYGDSDAPSIVFQTDDLSYGYLNDNSNQLTKVTDSPAGNDNEGFKDGNKTGDDFTYDANGNMITDKNKNITQIEYNHLNLPKKITFGTNGTIEYIYNATGQKLEKIVKEVSGTTHTDYFGGFQYNYVVNDGHVPDDPGDTDPPVDHDVDPDPKDPPLEANRFSAMSSQAVPSRPTLEFFPTAEGYYDYVGKKYVYQYKDHLGNIRLSYAKNPATQVLEIIEENNYYPFGLKHKGYNDYTASNHKYKYNGKELQDEMGLNFYDYGARNYDPAIGRWMNIDPLSEKSRRFSPYTYALNNPIYFIDPDGMEAMSPIYGLNGKFLGTDSEGFKGGVLFMDEKVFNIATKSQFKGNYTDKNGKLTHSQATRLGQNLDQVMGQNPEKDFTQSEIDMVNTAATDIISKGDDMAFDVSELSGGAVSSYYAKETNSTTDGNKYFTIGSNSPESYNIERPNSPAYTSGNNITFNLTSSMWRGGQFTVDNIQNTGAHEGNAHFKGGVTGEGKGHAKAYQTQINHSSWKGTTPEWKKEIQGAMTKILNGTID